jgi:D-alanyl-D-alanine carboxypeptidase
LLLLSGVALAAAVPIIPPPPSVAASSYLLIDADTQRVLVEKNSREPLPPASLTKIMTSYLVAVELEAGRVQLDDEVPISVKAWRTPGSRMFVREGTTVRLEDLLRGVIVQSGNDASVALAEYVAGSEAKRDNMRLISVVMGTDSEEARMRESQKLLSYGFRHFETQRLYEAGVPLKTAELWYGDADEIELGVVEDLYVTIPRGHYDDLEAELQVARVIEAPVSQGDEFGEVRLRLNDETVHRAPLVALAAAPEAGLFARAGHAIYLFFSNMFTGD